MLEQKNEMLTGYKVSIITPSFNQGKFIERTILSVLSQHCPQVEYLVVDGGSKDDTLTVLQRYAAKIKIISEPDNGQADAVNKGLKLTTGEIIGWLNSDDIYYPNAIGAVCEFFDKNPDIDIVYGDANHIDTDDNVLEPYYTEDWDMERLREICFICQPSVFFRRGIVEKYGMLDETLHFCMDYEYWLRLANKGVRFSRIPTLIAGSRLHQDTKTLSSKVKVHAEINDMLKKKLGYVPDRWLSNYAHIITDEVSNIPRENWKFPLVIALRLFLGSIKWNKKINKSVRTQGFLWISQGLRLLRSGK